MNSTLSLREDYTQRKDILPSDERILNMHKKLAYLKRTRKGEINVKDLRDYAPKLYNLTFRADSDLNTLKAKGIWAKKPISWPEAIFFGDPNNKNVNGTKPKENELRPMFNFLLEVFYKMYPKNISRFSSSTCDDTSQNVSGLSQNACDQIDFFNQNNVNSSAKSYNQKPSVNEKNCKFHYNTWDGQYNLGNLSSIQHISHENSIQEACKDLNDFLMDENNVISTNPAHSLNPEVNAKYHELNSFIFTLNDVLPEQSKFLITYILTHLVSNDKMDLMLMLEIILNKIKRENGMTDETYNMIQNNFGDIVKQMYLQPQTDVIKKDAKEDELVDSGFETGLIELQESNIDDIFLDQISDLLEVEQPIKDQFFSTHMQIHPIFDASNEKLTQFDVLETINPYFSDLFEESCSSNDAFMNNMGVFPRRINQYPVQEIANFLSTNNMNEEISKEIIVEKMEVDDHNYGSPQNDGVNQIVSSTFGKQIPSVVEDYENRSNDQGRKGRRGKYINNQDYDL